MQKKKWDLVALAFIPLIMTLGNSMLIPILPQITHELGITSLQVSLFITVYGVVAIFLVPVAGYLSDKFGRKVVIIPSLIIAGAGGALAGGAAWLGSGGSSLYWIILGGRLLQGIGAAGAFPIVIPLVGDMFKDEKEVSKSLGIIETSNTFGKVLSPIVGALLGSLLWYLPFMAIPVLCLISLMLVIFFVKVPKQQKEAPSLKRFLHSIVDIFKEKGRWLYAIFAIGCIGMFLIFGVQVFLSNELEDRYNIHGVVKGLVLAIPLGMLCLASYFTGKKIGKNKKLMKWIGFTGMAMSAVSLFGAGFLYNIYLMIGLFVISGIGLGIILPCLDALITEGISKEQRGTISSLYSGMRFIGLSAGPPVASLLMKNHHWILFTTLAVVSAAGAVITLFAIRPQNNEEKSEVHAHGMTIKHAHSDD
ncbi:MFS transporter [Paenibacillus sediminis]|uniref:ACDE family multidrug resistance protein n=1 Tax=Paenibacillus sediminis TaxID=664909 RepID=A0ABS4H6E9_9BACL|nr:MFS transporter [Paenibacillus sediminis]MBP1938119.1 ACDE family multidrug resistance protein [Paenibacillus sediminis]